MSFISRFKIGSALASLLLMPALAAAHPESSMLATGWAGFIHPLTGLDHLLAMFAVGLWAANVRGIGIARLALPLAFLLAMLAGAMMAAGGWVLPAVEPMIGVSVVVLGAVVALGTRVPVGVGVALVATFALFHGHAHATEAPENVVAYGLGFTLATATLHVIGLLVGASLMKRRPALMVGGSVIATAGLALLFA